MKTTTTFLNQSAYDYVAGRCLEINHFPFVALPLQAISIEKILKAIIALENKEFKPWKKKNGITNLFEDVSNLIGYYITDFKEYAPKLEDLYNLRYPDNIGPPEGVTMVSSDYNRIDSFYISLADQIKLPLAIKFRCGLHNIVFDDFDPFQKKWNGLLKITRL